MPLQKNIFMIYSRLQTEDIGMKKDNRKPKSKEVDFERETRVLLEEIRHNVKTIAEGHDTIVSKLDEIDNMLQKNESDHFKFQMHIESVKSQTGTIDIKVDRVEKELGTVKNAVTDIGIAMKDYRARLTKVEEKVSI